MIPLGGSLATVCHAFVRRLDHDTHAMGLESGIKAIGDLCRHFFLNLQPAGKSIDQSGQLGDSDHPVAWQIPDVNASDDRRYVVLAM